MKGEHQIEQQGSNLSSLITIVNWQWYQGCEQQIEQQNSSKIAASEQQNSSKIALTRTKEGKNEHPKRDRSQTPKRIQSAPESTRNILSRAIYGQATRSRRHQGSMPRMRWVSTASPSPNAKPSPAPSGNIALTLRAARCQERSLQAAHGS